MFGIKKLVLSSINQIKGARAERIAQVYLEKQSYVFLDKNWHCRFGELDLIMLDKEELVFVEVKMKSKNKHTNPEDMVSYKKNKKLILTAQSYLMKRNSQSRFWRFDTVAITGNLHDYQITHFKDSIISDW